VLRTAVERRLRDEHEQDGAVFPAYDDYCFGNLSDTIAALFGVDADRPLPADVFDGVDGVTTGETDADAGNFDANVDRVVAVVVDGYGLDSWKRDHADYDFLARLTDRGTVTPLTSVYPSETAAAITTFETGLLPCEHGRTGWNVYDPETDRSFLGLGGRVEAGSTDGAERVSLDDDADADSSDDEVLRAPETAVENAHHYQRLVAADVDCHRLQPFPESSPGVTQHEYDGLPAFGGRLAEITADTDTPGYVYGYVPHVDKVSHESGTESDDFQTTLAAVCEQLSTFVAEMDAETAQNTLLLVTADHGHVNTNPARNVDLSENETLMGNLRRYADGTPVCLSGSMRNVHLHLQDGTVAETRRSLADLDAHVFTRQEALDRNLFGDRPVSETFRRRCGDLILTHEWLGTWFDDADPGKLDIVGMHGGLTPAEMLVPFAAVRLNALRD
jgi:hypothetical protein